MRTSAGNSSDQEEKKASLEDLLEDPLLYINREISWIRFNERVLEEARDVHHPLLERVKFLAICGSNLDEFFMTRASLLEKQIDKNLYEPTPDCMAPLFQIEATRNEIIPLIKEYSKCWERELTPALEIEGIRVQKYANLEERQKQALRGYFESTVLPTLKKPVNEYVSPFVANLRINLLVVAQSSENGETFFIVPIPSEIFGRLIKLQKQSTTSVVEGREEYDLVFLEDLIQSNLDLLFLGFKITNSYAFRLTRDAEIEVKPDETVDFLRTMEKSVESRRFGKPARLEFESSMPPQVRNILSRKLEVPDYALYESGILGLADLYQLLKLSRPDLKDKPFEAFVVPELAVGRHVFNEIKQKDFVIYHPYDSFDIVLNLLRDAATDPDVTAIFITLYRIDPTSPVIGSLIAAAFSGKSVTVLFELKAKFDEVNNINWAKMLSKAGVKVVYNFPDFKVHAKLCLIIRKENGRFVQYSHLGSGNYNAITTRIYGDLGYLTANPKISAELLDLFRSLTSKTINMNRYESLLVSPMSLKDEILNRIERETSIHKEKGGGYIAFKLNALVDKKIIQALYRASMAGVKIDLNVRGLCCLRPGVRGVSDNIRVISIVGRFLEHARIYYFRNGGAEEVLLGSSDMMPRNLERRVEVLFSVPDPKIKSSIFNNILMVHLRDNVKARQLLSDGSYEKVIPAPGEEIINSQAWLIKNRGIWHE
jgi:polyphosphate kinase